MLDVLMLTKSDWANTGWRFMKCLQLLGLKVKYFKGKRTLFEKQLVYDIFKTIPDILLDYSRISIKPVLADKTRAEILGIKIGNPLLLWERTTFSKDKEVIEFSKFFTRGDRCNYYLEYKH